MITHPSTDISGKKCFQIGSFFEGRSTFRSTPLAVDFLEAPNADGVLASRGHRLHRGLRAAHGCDARYSIGNSAAADGLLITEGVPARRSVNHKLQGSSLQ